MSEHYLIIACNDCPSLNLEVAQTPKINNSLLRFISHTA